jgi:4-amino-4-deoxy-L-arabinose transferase-like glycosyltransferase
MRHLFLCISVASLLFFYRLTDRDLWSSHEARAAQDAQTIVNEGRWGLPRLFDDHVELQKPPLYYWLVAVIARVRDGQVDAWAVRLPAALAGLAGVVLLYWFGWRQGRPVAGLCAALILATAQHYVWLARVGRIDMPLTLTIGLTLVGYYLGRRGLGCRDSVERKSAGEVPSTEYRVLSTGYGVPSAGSSWRWHLLAYLAIACGLLLKGPIAVVLPLVVIVVHRLAERDWQSPRPRLRHSSLWWGVPLVLALVLPWYLWAGAQTNGEFYRQFFWYHNFERGLGGADALVARPWWFYAPRFAFDFLPWSPCVLFAGWFLMRQGRWRLDPEARFGLVWLLSMAVFLSCMRFKRADYLLPAYPGAALLLGCVAERCWQTVRAPRRLAALGGLVVTGCLAGWWFYLGHVLPASETQNEQQTFARAIRRLAPAPQVVLFFRAEDHALAFHLGRPLNTFLEWENLDIWAGRPGCHYIVMPPECASEWPQHVNSGRLEEVLRNTDLTGSGHKHPLVLMRTRPPMPGPVKQVSGQEPSKKIKED